MDRIKNNENNWRPAVGLQVSTFRTNEKITIEQLSEAARVSPDILKKIERGAYSKLSRSMLLRIADVLGLEVQVTLTKPKQPRKTSLRKPAASV